MSPQITCSIWCIVTLVAFVWLFSTVYFQMSPGKVTLVAFVWLFSSMCFQMLHQIANLRVHIVTLVTFVWLFSTVCFQMSPQITCSIWCIVTLVAFVWLSSNVSFQMCPQSARECPGGHKVTLVTFVWLFPTVCYQMSPKMICSRGCVVTLVAFFLLFSEAEVRKLMVGGQGKYLREGLWSTARSPPQPNPTQFPSGLAP